MVRKLFNIPFLSSKRKDADNNNANDVSDKNVVKKDKKHFKFLSESKKMNNHTPADFRAKLDELNEEVGSESKENFHADPFHFVSGVLVLPDINNDGILMQAYKNKQIQHQSKAVDDDFEKALKSLEKSQAIVANENEKKSGISKSLFDSFPSLRHKKQ